MTDLRGDVGVAAVKSAPPVAAIVFGLTVNDWAAILTVIYVGLQTAFLVADRLRKRRQDAAAERQP